MTLAEACLMLIDMGHVATVLHRDHLCQAEWSHRYSECPAAPHWAFSAADVAELSTAEELHALIVAKLRAIQAERDTEPVCQECGCSEDDACPDDGTGQPCHWVSRDPPLCSACVEVVTVLL